MAEQPGNGWGDGGWSDPPTPPTGAPPRPGLADVLDGAFQAVRRDLPTLLLATAVVVTTLTLVDVAAMVPVTRWLSRALALDLGPADPDFTGRAAILAGTVEAGTRVLLLAGTLLVSGVLAPVLAGRTEGSRALVRHLAPRLPALVAVAATVAALVVVAAAVAAVPGLLVGAALDSALVAAGLAVVGAGLGLLAAVLWAGARLALAPQAVVLEGLAPGAALARSAALTRGNAWRVLGVLVVAAVLTWVMQGLVSAPFATVAAFIAHPGSNGDVVGVSGSQLAVSALGAVVAATVSLPLLAAVLTGLYEDLRSTRG